MSNKLKLWHYTSKIALDNILELGVIELAKINSTQICQLVNVLFSAVNG